MKRAKRYQSTDLFARMKMKRKLKSKRSKPKRSKPELQEKPHIIYKNIKFPVKMNRLGVANAYAPLVEKIEEAEYNITKAYLNDENYQYYSQVMESDIKPIQLDSAKFLYRLQKETDKKTIKDLKNKLKINNGRGNEAYKLFNKTAITST